MKYFYYSGVMVKGNGTETYIGGYVMSRTGFLDTESIINYYKEKYGSSLRVFIITAIEVSEDTHNDGLRRKGD